MSSRTPPPVSRTPSPVTILATTAPPVVEPVAVRPEAGQPQALAEQVAQRVEQVAQQALTTQRRIVSGKYHFRENVLVVKVETKKLDVHGNEVEKKEEDVAYEVVGLSYKEAGGEYVNVLGARSEAALRPIFAALFASLKEVKDIDALVNTDLDFEGANGLNSKKEHLKTLTFSHYQVLGDQPAAGWRGPPPPRPVVKDQVSIRIEDEYVNSKGQPLPISTHNDIQFVSEASLEDRTLLKQMLAANEWQALLREAKDKTLTEHAWEFSSERVQESEGEVKSLVGALFDEKREEGQPVSCYADQLSQHSRAMKEQLKPLQVDVDNLKKIKAHIDEKITEMETVFLDRMSDLEDHVPYQVLVNSRREVREALEKVSKHHHRLKQGVQAIEEIKTLEFATRIRDQKKALGRAAFGKTMSMDWYSLFERYGFLEYRGDSYPDFLKEKLEPYVQNDVDRVSDEARELSVTMRNRFELEGLRDLEDYDVDFQDAESISELQDLNARAESRSTSPQSFHSVEDLDEDDDSDDDDSGVVQIAVTGPPVDDVTAPPPPPFDYDFDSSSGSDEDDGQSLQSFGAGLDDDASRVQAHTPQDVDSDDEDLVGFFD